MELCLFQQRQRARECHEVTRTVQFAVYVVIVINKAVATAGTGASGRRHPSFMNAKASMPCMRLIVAGVSPRRAGFDTKPFHVGFVVDKVAVEQVLLPEFQCSPFRIIPPVLRARSSPTLHNPTHWQRRWITHLKRISEPTPPSRRLIEHRDKFKRAFMSSAGTRGPAYSVATLVLHVTRLLHTYIANERTNERCPLHRAFFVKLIFFQPLKFVTVFTKSNSLSLSWAK
jgi:hypothetical protein